MGLVGAGFKEPQSLVHLPERDLRGGDALHDHSARRLAVARLGLGPPGAHRRLLSLRSLFVPAQPLQGCRQVDGLVHP